MSETSSIVHLEHLKELLRAEYRSEAEYYRERLTGDNILVGRCGEICKYPIVLSTTECNVLDSLTVVVRYEEREEETRSEFEPGKPVRFFYIEDEVVDIGSTCSVTQVSQGEIRVQVTNRSVLMAIVAHSKSREIGIHLDIETTTYDIMQESLVRAIRSERERFIQLRKSLIGGRHPAFRSLPKIEFSWLNESQNAAIQKMVEAEDVAVVHGPPGTGKTTTLVEGIIETLRRETQVLVSAPSNTAVDWISEQLMRRGVPVLRIGNPLRMSDDMIGYSYEQRYASHPDYPELWNIRKRLREWKGHSREEREHARRLRRRQEELEIKINAELFEEARVVSCTLTGAGFQLMEHRHFGTLFIDEAAQALEPACWTAILKADRVILGGDHKQLPPTIRSIEAARDGLAETLMQRLVHKEPQSVTLLTTQYRMHRDIMEFSSRWFYDGQLRAAPEVAERQISPIDTPLVWYDTSKIETGEQMRRNRSKANREEARRVVHLLRDYTEQIGMEKIENERIDIGIISPYKAQVELIKKLLRMQRYFRGMKGQITVSSVDGFQGQERDVVIISMVRSNEEGEIGFLRDLRRMNVALTRARMKLIVVGDGLTLSQHPFYAALIEHFKEHGEYVELTEERDSDANRQPSDRDI